MGALADLVLREAEPPAGAPGPVGAFASRHRTSATLVTRAADGSFEYGDEVDVTVSFGRWMELIEPGTLYWSGIEVRYLKAKEAEGFTRFHIVAALDPVEWNWFASAPLRPTYKETGPRKAAIEAAIREGRALRELPFDPFEQNRDFRVARLDDPMRLYQENGAAFEGGYVRGSGPAESGTAASWRFGLCAELPPVPASAPRRAATGYARVPPAFDGGDGSAIEAAAVCFALAGRVAGSAITFAERLGEVREILRRQHGRVR